ncbi:MAG: site-specific integrase [Actinomycetota bacterium]|nr:site-specific integrase [Actinomycetota bacterium]
MDDDLFAPLLDSWVLALEAERKSPRTVGNYRDGLELFARWLREHGDADPLVVTPATCREWLRHLDRTRSASTARTRWVALRQFYAWLAAEGEVASSPMELVKPSAVPDRPAKMLSAEQLRQVLAGCEGPRFVDRRDLALILLYADTGARLSEVAGLRLVTSTCASGRRR